MLDILLVRWKIHSPKFRLDYEAPFVRVHGNIDFYREFNAVGVVDLLKQLLFISSKAYITEFVGLNDRGELVSSVPLSQDC